MTVQADEVILYAAEESDLVLADAAALVCGVPASNVTGDFARAWQAAAGSGHIVIAVGGAAVHTLYYNECGWPNPAGAAGGSTPFQTYAVGTGVDNAMANHFVNAAGFTGIASLKLAVMLAYYAIHGTFPQPLSSLPAQETPQKVCPRAARPQVGAGHATTPAHRPAAAGGVGVYADFPTLAAVRHAVKLGWNGIGSTAALGMANSPYTAILSWQPDKLIAQGLADVPDVWWLSFWTVSWPEGQDSFHQGGYVAGHYAASTIQGNGGAVIPDYVIVDPEGYNTPAATAAEWAQWLQGWADGIAAVSTDLKAGFYCNQYQYETYGLAHVDLPAFVAVSPIAGNTPTITGGNVAGYIAYYATCPTRADVSQVERWGARYSTVQFRDSGVDCAP